jgi:tetratricopeptide (TPR) repeat protein
VPGELDKPEGNVHPGADDEFEAQESGQAGQPIILIPVEAADVARRRHRRLAIWWGSAVVAVTAAGLIYKHNVDPIHAQESYDAGVHLLQIARYPQAILSFDRAIDLKSNFTEAYLMRARAFSAAGQTNSAISDYSKVIEQHPRDPQPLIERGRVYVDGKDYQSAIRDAAAAIDLDNSLPQAYTLRGTAVRAMGNLEAALKDFDQAVKLRPNHLSYFERGTTYQLMNRHEEAIADFTTVIRIEPDMASPYYSRAKSERAIGDVKQAEEDHRHGRMIDGR